MNIIVMTGLYPNDGGAKKMNNPFVVHYNAVELARQGHQVRVYNLKAVFPWYMGITPTYWAQRDFRKPLAYKMDGIPIMRLGYQKLPKRLPDTRALEGMADAILKDCGDHGMEPDLLICETLDPNVLLGGILRRRLKRIIPMAVGIHNTDFDRVAKKYGLTAFEKVLEDQDLMVYRSEGIQKLFADVGYLRDRRSIVCGFGIPDEAFSTEEEVEAKGRRGIRNLVFAGRLDENKRPLELIEAFKKLNGNGERSLHIVGDGPLYPQAVQRASGVVVVHGEIKRSEVMRLMGECEVFVMNSRRETFGLVYIEAMARGCITIGTRGQGIDGVIQDGINGFLCDPDDHALLETLVKVIGLSPEKRATVVAAGYRTALEFRQCTLLEAYLKAVFEA